MADSQHGRLIVLCGPAGVGKGTVLGRVREQHPEIWLSVSATTRQPRPGEVDGVNYNDIQEAFDAVKQSNGGTLKLLANCKLPYTAGNRPSGYDASGSYTSPWLAPGTYKIRFYYNTGTNGWYGGTGYTTATPVTVNPAADTPNIDGAL